MNLVEEKKRGLIPPGHKNWPLQLIEHLTNTTSVTIISRFNRKIIVTVIVGLEPIISAPLMHPPFVSTAPPPMGMGRDNDFSLFIALV